MREKGGLRIDKMAHKVMEFRPIPNSYGVLSDGRYTAFYHEDELFSVRDNITNMVILIYAKSHKKAIDKVKTMTFTQSGDNCTICENTGETTINMY